MRRNAYLLFCLLSIATTPVFAQTGYFKVEGSKQGLVKGEEIKGRGSEWLRVSSFNMGSGADRKHKPIVLTREVDAASPKLWQALSTNEVLKSVVIQLVKKTPDGKETIDRTITLKNATISKIDKSVPKQEEIAFSYEDIQIEDK